jgi:3-dehydroquinate dehydratase-2
VAILDALNTCEFPIIEVHISNVHKRESFRHHSYVSLVASGVIAGFGAQGYQLALQRLARLISEAKMQGCRKATDMRQPVQPEISGGMR